MSGGILVSPLPNTLTSAEQRDGWRLLFDGKTFAGWRGLGYDSIPRAHWKIENASIKKSPTVTFRVCPTDSQQRAATS
jgi:hypothetical protein